ncbi:MAG TPA: hypothetical protein VFX59_30835 [Polyangiales bacterium]|nr:hypothetical protein [Polyangiales bacterium]
MTADYGQTAARPSELPGDDSKARGTVFVAFREAALELWGESGLRTLASALPDDVRVATLDNAAASVGFYPERFTIAWFHAAYAVMSHRSDREFYAFLDSMMDHGFGRVRRALLRLATPGFLIDQAASLWRHDHSHGTCVSETSRGQGTLVLTHHDYVWDAVARAALAEIFRYGVQLTGAQQVTASHQLTSPNTLAVTIRWRA